MKNIKVPELWLLVLIVGLPQLSETVYTPALPDIARSLFTSDSMVEYTLTIYLLGFALGTLFWGKLSDKYGRKPSLIIGLMIYVLGCIGCFYSSNIVHLMIFRFIQAFGGSTGSVLGQAICRDSFNGPERGKVFSVIGSALSFSPAVGPIIGGLIDQAFGWAAIFISLIFMGLATLATVFLRLPETYVPTVFSLDTIKKTFWSMLNDKRVLAFGFLVAACNGIGFSYYAEGSFYLIDILGLSPALYGFSFILLAMSGMTGGYISKTLHDFKMPSFDILNKGNRVIFLGAILFLLFTFVFYKLHLAPIFFICLTLASMSIIMSGIGIMIPNVLSLALEDYRGAIGTASSIFGFYYYLLISFFTLIMGLLHNNTLFPMPAYFLSIAVSMILACRFLSRARIYQV